MRAFEAQDVLVSLVKLRDLFKVIGLLCKERALAKYW